MIDREKKCTGGRMIRICSLFDGSGGFPLAGVMCGMTPVYAAEVEPYPIAVTRSRFPDMIHLGDVSKVNGAELEPVDVITFGSPCQDLSVAGKRAGLKHEDNGDDETTRSGLFMEAVRIIKEMRKATNGLYPRFAVWENVPGAFSSNGGEDFRTVLEELIKVVEPTAVMPAVPKNGWAYADYYCGDGWSIAYRVFDAQYWGVPQRRRRIYLVADFGGECAGKVLLEREGLRGYSAPGGTPWETTPGNAQDRPGADDRGGNNKPCVAYTLKIRSGCEGGGKGALVQEEKRATLATNNDQYLFQPVVSVLLDDQGGSQMSVRTDGKAPTLRAETHGHVPCVFEKHLFENHSQDTRCRGPLDVCPMLPAQLGTGGSNTPLVAEEVGCIAIVQPVIVVDQGGGKSGANFWNNIGPTLACTHGGAPAVAYGIENHQGIVEVSGMDCRNGRLNGDLSGTLQAKPNGGFSHNFIHPVIVKTPARYIVRRLTPTECARLQGFPDYWGHPNQKNELTDTELKFWTDVRNTHAEINGKAVKEYTVTQMLTWYNKLHTDSAEYKMWGNGIALPTALYVMQGIADALKEE